MKIVRKSKRGGIKQRINDLLGVGHIIRATTEMKGYKTKGALMAIVECDDTYITCVLMMPGKYPEAYNCDYRYRRDERNKKFKFVGTMKVAVSPYQYIY